jgi:hypothetical protein
MAGVLYVHKVSKELLKTQLCIPHVSFGKFLVRSKVGLVTNIRAKLHFMNLDENHLCLLE